MTINNTLSSELKNQINKALAALNLDDDITPKALRKAFWHKFKKASKAKAKRAPTGYNLFCKAERPKHATDGRTPQQVISALGAAWKSASKDVKDKYNMQSKAIKLELQESSPTKPAKKKRRPTGYNMYCKEKRSDYSKDRSPQEVMAALGAAWKAESDEIRAEFNEKARGKKSDDFSSLTLKELRKKCKEHSIKSSGKKDDLIERLKNPSEHKKSRPVPKDSDSESEIEIDVSD